MRRAGLPVQNSALAEIFAGGNTVQRHAKLSAPHAVGCHAAENLAQLFLLLLSALELFRTRLHKLFLHVQTLRRKVPRSNGHSRIAAYFFIRLGICRQRKIVFPRSLSSIHSHYPSINQTPSLHTTF